jgi:hypothetical protein
VRRQRVARRRQVLRLLLASRMDRLMSSVDHIAELIEGLDPGCIVTRFVMVAEVIDTDGDRALWVQTDDDAKPWDTFGLMQYALAVEQAGITIQRMDEED